MKRTLHLFSLFLFVTACNLGVEEPSIFVADVDDEFKVEIWENLDGNSRSLTALLETAEKQDCKNQYVKASIENRGIAYVLNIDEVTQPQPSECIRVKTNAKGAVDFGAVEEAVYELQINLKEDIVNRGQLIVSKEKYELKMDSDYGIYIPHPILHRIPDNIIWGYIGYRTIENETIVSDFIRKFSDFTAPATLEKGYYGYFELEDEMTLQEAPTTPFHVLTLWRTKQSLVSIRKTINQYRNSYPNDVVIKMWTSDGEEL